MTALDSLQDAIRAHLTAHPGDAAALLSTVADGLKAYEQRCKSYRSESAGMAVHSLMLSTRPKSVPLSIDAAFLRFPRGACPYASKGEARWWSQFVALAADFDGFDWLAMRGAAIREWWQAHVVPAVAEMEGADDE